MTARRRSEVEAARAGLLRTADDLRRHPRPRLGLWMLTAPWGVAVDDAASAFGPAVERAAGSSLRFVGVGRPTETPGQGIGPGWEAVYADGTEEPLPAADREYLAVLADAGARAVALQDLDPLWTGATWPAPPADPEDAARVAWMRLLLTLGTATPAPAGIAFRTTERRVEKPGWVEWMRLEPDAEEGQKPIRLPRPLPTLRAVPEAGQASEDAVAWLLRVADDWLAADDPPCSAPVPEEALEPAPRASMEPGEERARPEPIGGAKTRHHFADAAVRFLDGLPVGSPRPSQRALAAAIGTSGRTVGRILREFPAVADRMKPTPEEEGRSVRASPMGATAAAALTSREGDPADLAAEAETAAAELVADDPGGAGEEWLRVNAAPAAAGVRQVPHVPRRARSKTA